MRSAGTIAGAISAGIAVGLDLVAATGMGICDQAGASGLTLLPDVVGRKVKSGLTSEVGSPASVDFDGKVGELIVCAGMRLVFGTLGNAAGAIGEIR